MACCRGFSSAVHRQPFHRADVGALGLDRQHETRSGRLPVDDDGAGPAHAVLATHVGTGQPEVLPQEIDERTARFDGAATDLTVHRQLHVHCRHDASLARSLAFFIALLTSTSATWRRYAEVACTSEGGARDFATCAAASANTSSAGSAPTSTASASVALTGVELTPVKTKRDSAILPTLKAYGGGDADHGEIAVAAGDLLERAPAARPLRGYADRDEDLIGLEGGGEETFEEVGRRNGAPPRARLCATTSASSASATAGNSAAGSAWARLPPMVPRLRIAGWPINGRAAAISGACRLYPVIGFGKALAHHGTDHQHDRRQTSPHAGC